LIIQIPPAIRDERLSFEKTVAVAFSNLCARLKCGSLALKYLENLVFFIYKRLEQFFEA